MALRILILTVALLGFSVEVLAQQTAQVADGGYRLEGGKLVPMSKEETACALIRQQTVERTSVCDQRFAQQAGLSPPECAALTKVATERCDAYAQASLQQPLTVDQCLKAVERHHKCTLVITLGCDYTKALAEKMESIRGMRNAEAISTAIKSECAKPDKNAMVVRAQNGSLTILAMPSAK